MIAVTDYTTYADIRAVLGVDSLELPDATLGSAVFASALQRIVRSYTDDAGKTLAAHYDEIDPESMTVDEETLYYAIREYTTYIVAEACCSGLSLFAMKAESDGKSSRARFSSEATFKDVVKSIREKLAALSGVLDMLLNGTDTGYSVTSIYAIEPTTDRVTDE